MVQCEGQGYRSPQGQHCCSFMDLGVWTLPLAQQVCHNQKYSWTPERLTIWTSFWGRLFVVILNSGIHEFKFQFYWLLLVLGTCCISLSLGFNFLSCNTERCGTRLTGVL